MSQGFLKSRHRNNRVACHVSAMGVTWRQSVELKHVRDELMGGTNARGWVRARRLAACE